MRARCPGINAIPIAVLGGTASRILATMDEGRVMAVFARSFYLETGAGLVCIGPSTLGGGPLHALFAQTEATDWPDQWPRIGMVCRRRESRLLVGTSLVFDLAQAQHWLPPALAPSVTRLSAGLALLPVASPEGLAPLIPALAKDAPARFDPGSSALLRIAKPAIVNLATWLRASITSQSSGIPPTAAAKLIGLGPGLTPSGDDFLAGMMITLRALALPRTADRLAHWVLPLAQRRTGAISRAHLRCAAAGEGNEALHGMLAALCAADRRQIDVQLAALARMGHSSGWDALAGMVCVCGLLAHRRLFVFEQYQNG